MPKTTSKPARLVPDWLLNLDELTLSRYFLYLAQGCAEAKRTPVHILHGQKPWTYKVYNSMNLATIECTIEELPKAVADLLDQVDYHLVKEHSEQEEQEEEIHVAQSNQAI